MLAYVLAFAVGLGSFTLYMAAFFFPEVHRKSDFIWSGVGLFYGLVLWVCAGRITGGVLLGQIASVALLGWFGWQTLQLRREQTPIAQQTQLPGSATSLGEVIRDVAQQLQVKLQDGSWRSSLPPGVNRFLEQLIRAVAEFRDSIEALLATTFQSQRSPSPSSPPPAPASNPIDGTQPFAASENAVGTANPQFRSVVGEPVASPENAVLPEENNPLPEAPSWAGESTKEASTLERTREESTLPKTENPLDSSKSFSSARNLQPIEQEVSVEAAQDGSQFTQAPNQTLKSSPGRSQPLNQFFSAFKNRIQGSPVSGKAPAEDSVSSPVPDPEHSASDRVSPPTASRAIRERVESSLEAEWGELEAETYPELDTVDGAIPNFPLSVADASGTTKSEPVAPEVHPKQEEQKTDSPERDDV